VTAATEWSAVGDRHTGPSEALAGSAFGFGLVLLGEGRQVERVGLGLEGVVGAADELERIGEQCASEASV
jgi:hypothetical protein